MNPFVGSTKFCDWETGFLNYGYRYYDPNAGRCNNRDFVLERGGVNLYALLGNNGINQLDLLGLTIVTKEELQSFRDAIETGLEKVTDAQVSWVESKKQKGRWVLCTDKSGNGAVWNDLDSAIKGFKDYKIIRSTQTGNAYGEIGGIFGREVQINENIAVDLPVEDGVDASGNPNYRMERAAFEIVLWHELIGHCVKGLDHPSEPWNTYSYHTHVPLPANWGKTDPAIVIENMARIKLRLDKRRPQYYD